MGSYWFIYYTYELNGKFLNGNIFLNDPSCEYFRSTVAMPHIKNLLSDKHGLGWEAENIVIASFQKSSIMEMDDWKKSLQPKKDI